MKKAILTIGLFSLVLILTSFTTPETINTNELNTTTLDHVGAAGGRNVKLDNVGAAGGTNVKLDNVGAAGGKNVKLDNVGAAGGRNVKLD